jgi:mRNA-degrading endonuclease RelE of RelBE toxin-antitoxin system
MQTLEKIEDEVKQLPKAEQEALRDWLENILEDGLEFTDEFKAKIERAASETLQIRSLKSHRVLTPVISQSELAEEMFQPQTLTP